MAQDSKLTYTARELAAQLGMGVSTLWKKYAAGDLPDPAVRMGRVVRWSRFEIARWMLAGSPQRDKWLQIRAVWLDMAA
jgi:predicted DNA-binding transcriptional regulator AlpA